MKKVLVIGAGIGQVPLSLKIKERGLYLIVVTIPGDYPCIKLADKVYYVDIFDKEAVLNIARLEDVSAVISDQNDLMMPTVAFIAESLNLPGNKLSQVDSYCNKNRFRDNCDRLGIPVPKHIRVTSYDKYRIIEDIAFPCVVKPEDSQSSIGVKKVNDEINYKAAVAAAINFSRNNAAIVEEFFVGQEVVVEGFIYKGKYYNLGFADRKYFNLEDLFIPSQTIFPSNISTEAKLKLISYETAMAEYIKPDFAIVHSEYLLNDRGEIRVVESALRGGGVYISSHLVPLATNLDINDVILDCSLGYDIDVDAIFKSKQDKGSAYICFYLAQGSVSEIHGVEEICSLPYVHKCDVNLTIGDSFGNITQKGQRLGPIIISGESRQDIEEKVKHIQSVLNVSVDYNNDYNAVVWK